MGPQGQSVRAGRTCHKDHGKDTPDFEEARSKGKVVEKDGYHKPKGRGRMSCDCRKTTDKGAYRDVTIELASGKVVHFYHQHPVVVEHEDGTITVSSCEHSTSTTKERINRYLPSGYRVYQEDFDWYLSTPEGDREFEDGMVI